MDETTVDERLAGVPALLGWSTVCLCCKVSLCVMRVLAYTCACYCTSSGTSKLLIL